MKANEPAFPIKAFGTDFGGLTQRDYIAIKAMQGILSNGTSKNAENKPLNLGESGRDNKTFAIVCYSIADAMIAQSEVK